MILFWILGVLLVATAAFTVTQRSPVYSVIGLLANFVVLAILYLTLNAEFVFVIQLVVYGGAVLILFVFVIALLSSGVGPFPEGPNRMPRALAPAVVILLGAFAALVYGLVRGPFAPVPNAPHSPAPPGPAGAAGVFGSITDFGAALFTTHLLAFEVTAFILMVAVVGVVILAGDAPPQPTAGHHQPVSRARRGSRPREPIVKPR